MTASNLSVSIMTYNTHFRFPHSYKLCHDLFVLHDSEVETKYSATGYPTIVFLFDHYFVEHIETQKSSREKNSRPKIGV